MTLAALDNVRRLLEWSRQEHGEGVPSAVLSPVESVGIVGAGMMGRAIAAVHVEHQVPVLMSDSNDAVLAGVAASIAAELPSNICLQTQGGSGLIRATAEARDVAECDLVLESVVESLPVKQRLCAQLQTFMSSRAILASNTSTIPIGRLAESLADPSRFCGMHFFHPVRHRPLVEIIRGPHTSSETVAAVVGHARRIGKMPLVVNDGPGFVVNRLLFPQLGEALEMLRQGIRAEAIERAAVEFGMAMGPLRLMDEIGLDTTLQAGWVLAAAFPERIVSSPLLVSMVKAGRLGQKAGAGFYSYEPSSSPIIAETAIETIAARWRDDVCKSSDESITLRLVLPMLLEATRLLEEGIVCDARSIDLATLFGLGFPVEKGGLLWWADTLGADRIVSMLRSDGTMCDRRRPTAMVVNLAESGGRFLPEPIAATDGVCQRSRIPAAEAVP
jgi:3-hydroxyacyl-CoA dehydrogenase